MAAEFVYLFCKYPVVILEGKVQNEYRLVCGLENQTGRENTMPERVMGYDYAAYEEQIKELEELNRLNDRPAYAQRIHEDQKLAPVITGVLNWGNEEWKGPMDLHDMIRFPAENEDIIKPLVPNYPMNLIEVRKLPREVRGRLTSDFRLIADYFAVKKDKASLKKLFADQTHTIKHPDEFLDALSEVASDVQYRELKNILTEEQKEELTMCIIADELVGKGRAEERDILNCLNTKLVLDGRVDDLIKALNDLPYQNQLLQEYGLV